MNGKVLGKQRTNIVLKDAYLEGAYCQLEPTSHQIPRGDEGTTYLIGEIGLDLVI